MRKLLPPLLAGVSLAAAHAPVLADGERPLTFSIESQDLGGALSEWATQSGYRIGWNIKRRIDAPEVKGAFTPQAALERLLAGTSLTYKWLNPQLVDIRESASERGSVRGGERFVVGADAAAPAVSRELLASLRAPRALNEVEEVIVTGTHIAGLMHSASPFWTYDRSQIDAAGFGSIQAFSRSLLQNFAGGASESTVLSATGAGNSNNVVQGSGFNLRGLGNDATLVLLNGRRLAPGNISGNFVDVSMIPLSAVDRIDVVPDGASAIYGSDAVGGVVNVILRRTFDGAETRVRHGFVTDGNSTETVIAQTLGKQTDDGSVLANYEYYYRTPLSAAHRSYAQDVSQPITLLPQQTRGSFYFSAEQAVSPIVSVFADGSYAHRSSHMDMSGCVCTQRRPTDIDAYTGTVGAGVDLSPKLHLELTVSDSVSDTHQQTLRDAALVTDNSARSSIRSIEAQLNGWLGTVRHAFGIQFREENFDIVDALGSTAFSPSRRLIAGYAEVMVPVIGPASPGQQSRLELSLSGRGERYSDFGSTFNPRIGIVWVPSETLSLRGTYGTAFKAPLLNDLNPRPRFPVAVAIADPLTGGVTPTLFVFGGNPDLEPERATTWTASFAWQPADIWKIGATYYDIEITDRIVDPSTYVNPFDALTRASFLGPAVIQRAPSSHTVESIVASPEFDNFSGDPAQIAVLVDSRVHNLAVAHTRGVDLGASFSAGVGATTLEAGIDATYIIDFDSRLADAATGLQLLNTPYNPIDLKARARFGLNRGGFSLAAVVNFVDSYTDSRSGVATAVSAWTTADVTLGFKTQPGSGLLSDISAIVGITNVTDEDPPFVRNLGAVRIHFDAANHNALGRFYWLQFSKRW